MTDILAEFLTLLFQLMVLRYGDTCGGAAFLLIQRVLIGEKCIAVVSQLKMGLGCVEEPKLDGAKRSGDSCWEVLEGV